MNESLFGVHRFTPKKLCVLIWGDGASDDGGDGDVGHSGESGPSHHFLPYLKHYHEWCLLFGNVMLLCKISI